MWIQPQTVFCHHLTKEIKILLLHLNRNFRCLVDSNFLCPRQARAPNDGSLRGAPPPFYDFIKLFVFESVMKIVSGNFEPRWLAMCSWNGSQSSRKNRFWRISGHNEQTTCHRCDSCSWTFMNHRFLKTAVSHMLHAFMKRCFIKSVREHGHLKPGADYSPAFTEDGDCHFWFWSGHWAARPCWRPAASESMFAGAHTPVSRNHDALSR